LLLHCDYCHWGS